MTKYAVVRIFGSNTCNKCAVVQKFINDLGIFNEWIDAFSDETQSLCDANEVDQLPHVQVVTESGKVLDNFVGDFDLGQILVAVDGYELP